jgi:uncharacterized protein (TIGR02246 family)
MTQVNAASPLATQAFPSVTRNGRNAMYRNLIVAAALAAALSLPAAIRAQDTSADDKAAIESLWASYSAAQLAGDADAWLALWDEGGVQMPPGIPARGLDVLRDAQPKRMAAQTVSSFNIRPIDIVVADGWAWTRGTYEAEGEAAGKAFHVDGKFLTILKRQDDGGWKIYRDAFNSNVE